VNKPVSEEGFEVWETVQRGANQLRIAGNGFILGFDINALAAIHGAAGYDLTVLLHLFHHAERGLLQAIKNHGDVSQHTECLDPNRGHRGG